MNPAPSTPRAARYASLDAWRGIACLSVIVFHVTGFYAAGRGRGWEDWTLEATGRMWAGVTLFFVISGYCIAASADRVATEGQSIRQYFYRRFRRIFPTYWIVLALTIPVVLGAQLNPTTRAIFDDSAHGGDPLLSPAVLTPQQWLGNLTLAEGWRTYLPNTDAGVWWLGPAWTLGYEEQFYALTGVLILLAGRRWLWGVLALSAAVWIALLIEPDLQFARGLFLDGRWLFFALGIAVYHFRNYAVSWQRWLAPGYAGLALAWAALQPDGSAVKHEMLVAAVFTLMLVLLERWDAETMRLTIVRPLAWCGVRCYSIYLIHWPVTKAVSWAAYTIDPSPSETLLVAIPAAIAGTLIAAEPLYQLVERRFTNRVRIQNAAPAVVEAASV